jgi:uncharacterized protein YutE (UPF0331/DUF86 family)
LSALIVLFVLFGSVPGARWYIHSTTVRGPTTKRTLFDLLAPAGWLPDELARRLRDMAGSRCAAVHGRHPRQ